MRRQSTNEKKVRLFYKIRDRIYSGHYWPREKLVEADLANEMNVSRTIIREVLRDLAAKDLVTIEPFKGAFVSEISYRKMQEFVQIEAILEGFAAFLATKRLTGEQIKKLHTLLEQSENECDPKVWSTFNRKFHKTIIASCGNSKLIETIRDNVSFLKFWFIELSMPEEIAARDRTHQEILKALENKKPDSVRDLMEKHIMDSLGDLLKRIRKSNPNLVELKS